MQIILSDYNCEGQAKLIVETLKDDPGISWVPLELRLFRDVGLHPHADDETVWRFCQEHSYLLLTGNRSTRDGAVSL